MGGTIQLRAETHDGQDNPGDRGLYTYGSRSGGVLPIGFIASEMEVG